MLKFSLIKTIEIPINEKHINIFSKKPLMFENSFTTKKYNRKCIFCTLNSMFVSILNLNEIMCSEKRVVLKKHINIQKDV